MGKKRAARAAEEVVAVLEPIIEEPVTVARAAVIGNPVTHPAIWVNLEVATQAIGLSPQTVWRLGNLGKIRKWKVGTRRVKYYMPDIEAFVQDGQPE